MYLEKSCPIDTSNFTNPSWTRLGLNPENQKRRLTHRLTNRLTAWLT